MRTEKFKLIPDIIIYLHQAYEIKCYVRHIHFILLHSDIIQKKFRKKYLGKII